MPKRNPYPIDPPILPTPAPFNVERLVPISSSTMDTNDAYRSLLKAAGSVWQFYQLVLTQWPVLEPPDATKAGIPANTFPGNNANSAFTNVTMETFDQVDKDGLPNIQTGCMNCHDATRKDTDFLWSLKDHAIPPNDPLFLFGDKALRDLQGLLRSKGQ
jgi:hypothetical protein